MHSPTLRLLAGLAITLTAVTLYSGYTIVQLRGLKRLQAETIDRNRTDSLLLLRIQNNLNSLGLAMRDMLDGSEPYPLTAWQASSGASADDLEDAMAREATLSPDHRTADQNRYLANSHGPVLGCARPHLRAGRSRRGAEARALIRLSLQARQEALSTAVARLLVQNNESEQQAGAETQSRSTRAWSATSISSLAAMLVLILRDQPVSGALQPADVRAVAALSARRSELAQQLISMQESTFRSISRELHDEFGQILTAIGAMLQRADRRGVHRIRPLRADLREVREIVQIDAR